MNEAPYLVVILMVNMGVLMLWRVHPQTVNLVPRGKHSRFDSVDTHHIALVTELVYVLVLETRF